MNDDAHFCICRRVVGLGLAKALGDDPANLRFIDAIRACRDRGQCHHFGLPSDGPSSADRRGTDRRSGIERRQNRQAWPAEQEQRSGQERRSGGDRRGLLAGKSYTPRQTYLNLKAWCNGHCKGAFDLWIDEDSGGLRFRFENAEDREGFMKMLKAFKSPSGP